MVRKIRTLPENWSEILSDVEKIRNHFACLFFFFQNCTFSSHFSTTRDILMPGSPSFLQFQMWLGSRCVARWLEAGPASPASLCTCTAGSCMDPSSLIPFNLALQCWDHKYLSAVLTICLSCREDNILCSTYFPNESLCPKFNLVDIMDFFLKFLYKI